MNFYNNKTVEGNFDDVIVKVTENLKKEGFGVLTQIDVNQTLKNKLDIDFRKYRILGACNPTFAYKALQIEEHIGVMLPCNLVVQERAPGVIEVSSVNPQLTMKAIGKPELEKVASEIQNKLLRVIESL